MLFSSQDKGIGAGGPLNPLQDSGSRAVLPCSPPTSLLSPPPQVTVSPALATMVGHAWRRRRGSDAYVCLAMGGTCAMLVSVFEGLGWGGGRSEAWALPQRAGSRGRRGGGTGFGFATDESHFRQIT